MVLQPHIKCDIGDVAENILIAGDPNRIDLIAKYLDNVKEIADNRGLKVITGTYKGTAISAATHGMGCPSAAIVIEELANIGAKKLIRIGTCGGLKKEIEPGDLIIPYAAIRAEGTTKEYLPIEFPAVADSATVLNLVNAAESKGYKYFTGVNRTHDAFYEPVENLARWGNITEDSRMKNWSYPLVSSEMECSAVFFLGMMRGLKTGAILSVNTTEPLDLIRKDPDMVYQLSESSNAKQGVERAIEVALEAMISSN